jgi:hypothetical protein
MTLIDMTRQLECLIYTMLSKEWKEQQLLCALHTLRLVKPFLCLRQTTLIQLLFLIGDQYLSDVLGLVQLQDGH